jgi:hypothetical protein
VFCRLTATAGRLLSGFSVKLRSGAQLPIEGASAPSLDEAQLPTGALRFAEPRPPHPINLGARVWAQILFI